MDARTGLLFLVGLASCQPTPFPLAPALISAETVPPTVTTAPVTLLQEDPDAGPPAPHVVLVSIDGMRADYCTEADAYGLKIPNLRGLMARGRYALGVTGTFPTVTYAAHTTLVTGARPSRHGILTNRPFDPMFKNQSGWSWYAEAIKAETLWDAVHAAGKTSGSVYWPVTVGAQIDDDFPQFWRAKIDEDDRLLRALMTPGLAEAYSREYAALPAEHRTDAERGDAAEFLIRERRHDLTLVYFTDLDEAEHTSGPGSREALATLERTDAQLGRVLRAIDAAGDAARTTVVVVSDHGFAQVSRAMRPGALLHHAGLIDVNAGGTVTGWRAGVMVAGGLAGIYLADPKDHALHDRVAGVLAAAVADDSYGIRAVYDRAALDAEGAFAGASFAIEAKPGFEFSPGWADPIVGPSGDKGAHGYPPEMPEMRASLIAAGRRIKRGPPLPVVSMLAIAPTVADLLGVTLKDAEAKPLAELLESP
jgi:predicted AlkP superfamily pyrophosphatase or phosphodiesterase